uniref:Uncharacterized protein n=1 Tax=Oryza brachyantha TaxID=4533 RepID=J3L1X1_ORYBR
MKQWEIVPGGYVYRFCSCQNEFIGSVLLALAFLWMLCVSDACLRDLQSAFFMREQVQRLST